MADEEISARVRDGAKSIEAARRIEMDENEKNEDALLEAALCLVLTNAVEVQDHEGRSLGIAVYGPNFSWINHSCSPNACYRFIISPPDNVLPFRDDSSLRILPAGTKSDNGVHNNIEFPKGCSGSGPRVIVRSIKRIKKGEEVTVAYTDLLQPKEISASNMATSSLSSELSFYRDEATRKLTDYVEEVTAEYLAVGDPESCCKKLENMLITGLLDELIEVREGKSQLNFRLHPLHHLALNTYTVLASAYKIRASDVFALHSEVGGLSWEALSMSRISAAYSLFLAASTYHLFCFESSLLAAAAATWKRLKSHRFHLDIWDFDVRLTHNDVDFKNWANKSASGTEDLGYIDQWRMDIFQLGVHCLLYGGFLAGICYGPHSHWTNHIRSALNYEGG
ncbi:protein SET DOMAIN GROUP [Salix suchowensis]|nr:protein SET DOMAIN GROUP [Salix suchowensis]